MVLVLRPGVLLAVLATVIVGLTTAPPAALAHFPQSITATVAPGANLSATSSAIPPAATSATITAKPAPGTSSDLFDNVSKLLALQPTRGRRVVTCVAFFAAWVTPDGPVGTVEPPNTALALLFLKACIHIALSLPPAAPAARAAAAGCPRQAFGVPVKVRRANGRYSVTAQGTPVRAHPAVKVTCRRKGSGIELRLRSRTRGRPLRTAVGRNLALGFINPSKTGSATIQTTFAVR